MDKKFVIGILFGIVIGVTLLPSLVDAAIPPTPAWQKIGTNDTDITTNPAWANATQYNDELWIITDGSILIEVIQYTGGVE